MKRDAGDHQPPACSHRFVSRTLSHTLAGRKGRVFSSFLPELIRTPAPIEATRQWFEGLDWIAPKPRGPRKRSGVLLPMSSVALIPVLRCGILSSFGPKLVELIEVRLGSPDGLASVVGRRGGSKGGRNEDLLALAWRMEHPEACEVGAATSI